MSAPVNSKQFNHYFKDVKGLEFIDVYQVIKLWGITDPALQHAIKKLLVAGGRGAKSMEKDISEVIASCQRCLEMLEEDRKRAPGYVVTPAPVFSQPLAASIEKQHGHRDDRDDFLR